CCTSGLVQSETPGSDIQWLRALSYGLAVELEIPQVLPVGVAVPLLFKATVEGTGARDEAAPAGGEAAGRTRQVALPGTYQWEATGPELELAAGETADPANEITALQAGEVTVTVAYIPPGGEEMKLEAEPVAIGVAGVAWEGYDPGDGHTGYEAADPSGACGGTGRIFAERRQPPGRAGDELHDKAKIRVTLTSAPPAGETLTVYFRVLDPDHYSEDSGFDTNGAAPDDNLAAGGNAVTVGATILNPDLSASDGSFTMVGDGATDEIEMVLEIAARQPGNNFAVVAHTSPEYVESVGFAADGVTLVVAETGCR
ncbi:MAG: hypothetical protein HYV63_24160, partial [Candidatus Schekmanbacteria bacterium]|nr:hypothetical protein [Candidatus Schekmanbacteria bacterium]